MPTILSNPSECHLAEWVRFLLRLLCHPVGHGFGRAERFFEFILDLASALMSDIPKDYRSTLMGTLREEKSELQLPSIFASRIQKLLPFMPLMIFECNAEFTANTDDLSLSGSVSSLDLSRAGQSSSSPTMTPLDTEVNRTVPLASETTELKPWEWIEDCAGSENGSSIPLSWFRGVTIPRGDCTYVRQAKLGPGQEL
jgi:hypothetical protein